MGKIREIEDEKTKMARIENTKIRRNINKVEGYDPEAEIITYEICDEVGEVVGVKKTLPLPIKQEWFYLKYPDGRIIHKVIENTPEKVEVSCYLYRHYKDDPEHYIRTETVIMTPKRDDPYLAEKSDAEIMGITINKAKAKAEANTLHKAGFGFQYESMDDLSEILAKEAEETLPPPRIPKSVPGQPSTSKETFPKQFDDKDSLKEEMKEKLKAIENHGFEPSVSAPEKGMPKKSITDDVTYHQTSLQDMMDVSFKSSVPVVDPEPVMEVSKSSVGVISSHAKMNWGEAMGMIYPNEGCTLGDIYNDSPNQLLYIYQRTDSIMLKEACRIIIKGDDTLSAVAHRKGLSL